MCRDPLKSVSVPFLPLGTPTDTGTYEPTRSIRTVLIVPTIKVELQIVVDVAAAALHVLGVEHAETNVPRLIVGQDVRLQTEASSILVVGFNNERPF